MSMAECESIFFKIYIRKAVCKYMGMLNQAEYINLMTDNNTWRHAAPSFKQRIKDNAAYIIDHLFSQLDDNELKQMLREIEHIIDKYAVRIYSKYGVSNGKSQDN